MDELDAAVQFLDVDLDELRDVPVIFDDQNTPRHGYTLHLPGAALDDRTSLGVLRQSISGAAALPDLDRRGDESVCSGARFSSLRNQRFSRDSLRLMRAR